MSMNKYMHPRNIYKIPPDFSKLVKLYNDFATVAKTGLSGKVSIDFKNPNSLRVLTKCLLKSDFNLDVIIPEDKLVPTLPLRLNYILWLEDLLAAMKLTIDIKGIDIGTGACAIYPLLAAKKNKWHILGTETDKDSIKIAQQNIDRNQLQDCVELSHNSTGNIIKQLFINGNDRKFHFSMCNPPFYSNLQELCESRSPARPPPKNGFTGSPQELITEGGELEFCRKIIKESRDHENNVIVYTTMVGHKYTLAELIQDLQADGIKYTHTEFCQGHVTRWGLAWTYQNYDIYKLVPPREKLRKTRTPIVYLLPELPNAVYTVEEAFKKLSYIFRELNIDYKVMEKRGHNISVDLIAKTNTWSNQRRKRRLQKRLQDEIKKIKTDDVCDQNMNAKSDPGAVLNLFPDSIVVNNSSHSDNNESNNKALKINGNEETTHNKEIQYTPVVHALLKLFKKDKDILLQMEFYEGIAGKQGLHQIVQYIKNNWK
ncbi:hypothetical protein K1T71_007751 [Dendrolimus kikuchii]|uniref:Uncharacterized protein n=1 Tax=Dendrolimus kikuchii TaxID=765133 RepID=A0ACC1CZL0_9NEOP|nr:hypothetical protein K1T71_007751 [Dendrolimus kikuchii]